MSKVSCGAILLAAGMSRRMGTPKLLLPWHGRTIIKTIVTILEQAQLVEKVIVLGSHRRQIQDELVGANFKQIINPKYRDGDMLKSIQYGIRALDESTNAALIILGDQPTLSSDIISLEIELAGVTEKNIIIPSYQMKRGHPWLIKRPLWQEILELRSPYTLRDVINRHDNDIHYLITDDPHVLRDVDTPEAYQSLLDEIQGTDS
ncbi:MAG: nucleotidyltransferase family protein [Anaerolineae bacterium]|nr:nucleotidyltransferase family protein [Anaerolineae bacterium]